jgi:hypothetical protein
MFIYMHWSAATGQQQLESESCLLLDPFASQPATWTSWMLGEHIQANIVNARCFATCVHISSK